MGKARDAWYPLVSEAFAGFRLDCLQQRRSWRVEEELYRAGVAEILKLRLLDAYSPIFRTLDRIERDFERIQHLIGDGRPDAWGPPVSVPSRPAAVPRSAPPVSGSLDGLLFSGRYVHLLRRA